MESAASHSMQGELRRGKLTLQSPMLATVRRSPVRMATVRVVPTMIKRRECQHPFLQRQLMKTSISIIKHHELTRDLLGTLKAISKRDECPCHCVSKLSCYAFSICSHHHRLSQRALNSACMRWNRWEGS